MPRILVIDDNPTNVVLAKACLKGERVLCEVAPDGERGLELAFQEPPDLILLDIMLPGMDGFQVCERLKADPRTSGVPVLMITALQELDDKIRGLRAGAEDFISKPFNRAELQARVRSLLRMKHLQEEMLESERLRVRYQMSQESERLKDAFISIVSHEIKTPLTVLKGYVSLLRQEYRKEAGDTETLTGRIVEGLSVSLAELESLMRQLLDLSKMRSGLSTLNKIEVSVASILARIFEDLEQTARDKGIALILEVDPGVMPLRADPEKLDGAFRHLVLNAVNFTAQGGEVRATLKESGDAVEVRVSDNGIGISSEHLPHIFDAFYQVEHYMTRTVEGMGIGLSIVKHIIEDHGGRIEVASKVNQGTTFSVHLPRSMQDVREILRHLREQLQELQLRESEQVVRDGDEFERLRSESLAARAAFLASESAREEL